MNCRLEQIFIAQRELMPKFYAIELANDVLETPDVPVNIQNRFGQKRLRNYAWRITEEVAEALNVIRVDNLPSRNFREEVSDCLHFLTEFTIIAGYEPKDLAEMRVGDRLQTLYDLRKDAVHVDFWWCWANFIVDLGMTVNLLKVRDWKQKTVRTDPNRFRSSVIELWLSFIAACVCSKIKSSELFADYFAKHMINVNRQRDGV